MEKLRVLRGAGGVSPAQLPHAEGWRVLIKGTIAGVSMFPALKSGDLLELESAEDLRPGDIVVFGREGRLICHRVRALRPGGFIVTQGDSVTQEDAPVHPEEMVARVARVRTGFRYRLALKARLLLRALTLGLIQGLKAVPGLRGLVSWVLWGLCRVYWARLAPIKSLEIYSFQKLSLKKAHALVSGDTFPHDAALVACLFGRTIACLWPVSRRLEVHEALTGLGLEERLRRILAFL